MMNARNSMLLLVVMVFGLSSCSRQTSGVHGRSESLTCRISADRTAFSPGEVVKIQYTIGNMGPDDINLPFCHLDGRLVFAPAESTVATSLEITNDVFGVIEYDNFGYSAYLPPTENKRIAGGGSLSGEMVIDSNSTFVVRQKGKPELLGGIDHVGLRLPGKYHIRMVIRVATEHELKSNDIEIEIKEK